MKVFTFKATCNDCKTEFDNPLLSDLSYGEFIARGERGTVFAYLPAINNFGWDRINQLFKKTFPKKDQDSETNCFQWIIGKCLDLIDNQELSIVNNPICPNCHRDSVMYGDEIKTGELNLPDATFSVFLALNDMEQETLIRNLCDLWLEKTSKP